ncbi:hypothetical protein CDO87_13705 [Sagittula sp. P11]|nr:hypothetical protein CDO87_13705 [Sagittula sp. P11]
MVGHKVGLSTDAETPSDGLHRRHTIEQMIDAIEIASARGDTKLDSQHFVDAYFAREGCSAGENIFLAPRWSAIQLHSRTV